MERWHFGMVNDYRRNGAYDSALQATVARLRARLPEGESQAAQSAELPSPDRDTWHEPATRQVSLAMISPPQNR